MEQVLYIEEYAKNKAYIVAQRVEGDLYFHSATDNKQLAYQIADELMERGISVSIIAA